jgi:hypothetical protein
LSEGESLVKIGRLRQGLGCVRKKKARKKHATLFSMFLANFLYSELLDKVMLKGGSV